MGTGWGRAVRSTGFGLVAMLAGLASSAARAEEARPKRIVTTFTIIQDIAQNVAGDRAVVSSITKPGAEIHDYDPTPLDIVKAQEADLVLWNGLGLERWFERFFQRVRDVPSAVVSDGIVPIAIADGAYAAKPNPHAWMSPANALIYVDGIRKALGRVDPANAAAYDRNAAAYSDKLKAVGSRLRESLARIPADRRVLVTCEGAFSYLAADYGLKEVYLWAVNSDEEGSPQQVRRTIDAVRKQKVPVVFCESTISDRPMRQVAKDTSARFGGILYVDSLTADPGPAPTYLALLERNADTILKGFGVGQ